MKQENIIAERPSKLIYRDGDKTVKLFDASYSPADVLNEALNMARVGETPLNIPKLHEVAKIDGKWAIVYDYIEGETLAQMMQQHPEKYPAFLEMFVELQMEVHRQQVPLLSKLKDKMHRKICLTDLDATVRYELHTRLEGMPNHTKLCHGDFSANNIIITKDGTPYILDWSHATQGNASADVARTYLMLRLHGNDTQAQEYLKLFCEKSGTAEKYVQRWMPIVAASQSVKSNSEERNFLLSWVNVVDFE